MLDTESIGVEKTNRFRLCGRNDRGNKTAFTLAEVLITLGIIGVVAAMTIPNLMAKINNIKLKSQFKEAYSILSQTVKSYNTDEERYYNVFLANTTVSRNFYKSFLKYFNSATDCGYFASKKSSFCLEGTTDKNYKNYSKNTNFISTLQLDDGQFYLQNGMLIMFDHNYSNPFVSVDINGKGNKPNAWGHDVFTFELKTSEKEGGYELVPMGAPNTTFKDKNRYCSLSSTDAANGIACSYYALKDEDYFKKLP